MLRGETLSVISGGVWGEETLPVYCFGSAVDSSGADFRLGTQGLHHQSPGWRIEAANVCNKLSSSAAESIRYHLEKAPFHDVCCGPGKVREDAVSKGGAATMHGAKGRENERDEFVLQFGNCGGVFSIFPNE